MRINVCDHDDVSDTASPAGRYTLLALCIGAILNAALSATAGASESSDLRDVEQVIVTARKVNERLQDVPVSITAISAEQLQQRGAVDLKDVVRTIPGVTFGGVDRGQSVYTIRGVASGLDTTGIYLDDISLLSKRGNEGAFDPVFFDMERLEVLKGPQGTLYGGSAMGGAIK